MGFSSTGSPLVGPLLDENERPVLGQYVCAGYQGHGMPRAYAWYVGLRCCDFNGLADVWLNSAEVVARMMVGEIDGTGKWEVPEWLPRCYLTVPPGDSEA